MTKDEAVVLMAKEQRAKNYAAFNPKKTCGHGFSMTTEELKDNNAVIQAMSVAAQQVRAFVPMKYRGQIRINVREGTPSKNIPYGCPKCGGTKFSSTLVGYVGEDLNTLTCGCGWKGVRSELGYVCRQPEGTVILYWQYVPKES